MKIRTDSGFTLIELLIVIAILGIVLAIAAPNFSRYRDNANLREAARDISSDIQFYKQRAVSENVEHSIIFNAATNNYTIKKATDTITIKSIGVGNAAIEISGNPTFVDDTVTFQTRGTTNGGKVEIQHGKTQSKATIIVSSMGRVRIEYAIK